MSPKVTPKSNEWLATMDRGVPNFGSGNMEGSWSDIEIMA